MKPSEWIDISTELDPDRTPIWPGSPPLTIEPRLSLDTGDAVTDSTIRMSVHTGTHIDSPAHFLADGASVDEIGLERLCGPCFVVDLTGRDRIHGTDLADANLPCDTTRLLLKTDNRRRWGPDFDESFVGLTAAAATWVVDTGIELVGIDYLSIQPFDEPNDVHIRLLTANVCIVEGLRLSHVDAGPYELVCAPLKLSGAEAAPARVMIRPVT